MSVNHYTRFVQQMGKLSAQTPLTKPPNNLNAHLLVSSPFPDPEARRAARQISDFEVRRKSALFNATARTPEQAQLMLKVLETRLKDLLPASEQKAFTSVAGTKGIKDADGHTHSYGPAASCFEPVFHLCAADCVGESSGIQD
ncbi:hypothetical protein HDU78_011415 [Chytriomyces hyalinus]|nr:hypothetical protein HDU78_011415 [Chytriomyces hyalinus]